MSFLSATRPRKQLSPTCLPLTTITPPRVLVSGLTTLPAALLACALFCVTGCAHKASPPTPQPPAQDVISRVTAAKTIFLSNAGGNNYFNGQITGGPNASYDELYAALQQWGYFHLVDSPAHADLIFQIRGAERMPELRPAPFGNIIPQQYRPMFELTILDPRTDPANPAPIDTITVMAGRGADVPKGEVAFARSIEWLTYQISKLVNVPPPSSSTLQGPRTLRPSFETLMKFTAPVPPQVLDAKTIFVDTDASPNDRYYKGFRAALNTWAYYHLADTPASADIVFHYHHDPANGISITLTAPNSKVILWTITDPHYGFYNQAGQHRAAALNQNLITELKLLNHISLTQAESSSLH
ncbi:MAG: hypothetical protein WB439_02470 [Acidobacteriaceae bacterium]